MGLSNRDNAIERPQYSDPTTASKHAFEDFFNSRFPVASGAKSMAQGNGSGDLMQAVFNNGGGTGPQLQGQPDYSNMIAQNAQPKKSSGAADIFKLFFGG